MACAMNCNMFCSISPPIYMNFNEFGPLGIEWGRGQVPVSNVFLRPRFPKTVFYLQVGDYKFLLNIVVSYFSNHYHTLKACLKALVNAAHVDCSNATTLLTCLVPCFIVGNKMTQSIQILHLYQSFFSILINPRTCLGLQIPRYDRGL